MCCSWVKFLSNTLMCFCAKKEEWIGAQHLQFVVPSGSILMEQILCCEILSRVKCFVDFLTPRTWFNPGKKHQCSISVVCALSLVPKTENNNGTSHFIVLNLANFELYKQTF